MKIFPNLDPKENKLPADTSGIIRKVKMKTPSIVNPDFFISNNPAIKANLKQFHPIDPAKVSSKLTRMYKGQKVAFCCAGCPATWDKLTDADKQTKLTKVAAAKEYKPKHQKTKPEDSHKGHKH